MALNFPANPQNGETYTEEGRTWQYDGTAWNVVSADSDRNVFTRFLADSGSTDANIKNDSFRLSGGTNITTSIVGDEVTIDFSGSVGSTQNLFDTVNADEGSINATTTNDSFNIVGGTNISTSIATDTKDVTVNMNEFSINFLSDVDTQSSAPTTGQVLKWDGSKWAPAADIASGGAGLDADTLDGFDSAYYLNYNNLNNKPAILTLASLSIGVENTPSGNGAITYDDSTGIFKFTPPTAAGIGALTSVAFSDLTSTPTTIVGYGITDAFDGQYSSLTGTPSIPSDLGDLTDSGNLIPDSILDLGISDGSDGQVLTTDGAGNFTFTTVSGDGGGEANQNAFSNVAVSGQTTVAAETTTDTLTLAAGSGIAVTTDAGTDTITITSTVSSGASDFDQLGDVSTASLTIDKIYEPAIVMLRVDNNGTSAYTFDSHYSGNNPTIYALSGTTIAFDLDLIAGHPFEIQDSTGTAFNTGLVHVDSAGNVSTGASAQGKSSGTLYWRIPETTTSPPNFRYQCQSHVAMVGAITIKDLSAL